ncbi:MAG: hypothetical protein JXA00_00010 [Candidatus Thermoplasmatota archaeon]|nr:hypothetical protein [Candidatus Thermoplasmatota archaeon]
MMRDVARKSLVVGMLVLCLGVCTTSCISGGSNLHLTVPDVHPGMLGEIPPEEEWNKTFGGPNLDDAAYDVQQTNDGGYIIAGYAKSLGIALWNPWLIKTDSQGTMEWNTTFDYYALPSVSGRIWSVQQTADDGYILGCTFYNATLQNSGETRLGTRMTQGFLSSTVLIKTDSQGHEEWNRTYPGLNYSWCFCVRQTSDGGYIATGGGNASTEGSPDVFLLKTHPDGSLQWLKTYGTSDMDEEGHMVQQTTDGGYIITGMSDCNYVMDWGTMWLIKTDASGTVVWDKKFEGATRQVRVGLEAYGNSVQQTADSGFIIAGAMDYMGCLLKTDANGNETWRTTPFLNDATFIGYSAKQTTDGGYIATGNGLAKTDGFGNEVWNITIPQPFTAAQQTSDGGYVIAGSSAGYYNGDVWVIKFAPEPGTPALSFTVTGGLGVHVKITNNGTTNATNVAWQVHVEGGILHRMNSTENGTVDIAVGETKTIKTRIFFGLGRIQVTAMVGDATKTVEGTQLLILSILKQ